MRGADVSFRNVTIKIPDRGYDQGCEWRHAPEAWAEIWEKSVSWDETWARPDEFVRYGRRTLCEDRWKSQHKKIVPLSLCLKTFPTFFCKFHIVYTLFDIRTLFTLGEMPETFVAQVHGTITLVYKNKFLIKSFVPELRSLSVFRLSGFLCYIYIYIYICVCVCVCVMNILCTFYISVSLGMIHD